MECIRALCSQFACLFFCEVAVSWSWCEYRERPVGIGTDGTSVGGVWLRPNVCFFSSENQKRKARASRSRASLQNTNGYYITGQSSMPDWVQQYDSTVGAERPTPQQPPIISCGLPGPYGGSAYIRESTSVCRYIYVYCEGLSPLG